MNGDTGYCFTVGVQDGKRVVYSEALEGTYAIPVTEELSGRLLAADGTYAYLYSDTQILQVALLTGETLPVFMCDLICDIYACDAKVVYIAAYYEAEQTVRIQRLYLPELRLDEMYAFSSENVLLSSIYLYKPESTWADVQWYMWNPEFVVTVKSELDNPDSAYKTDYRYDYSEYWEGWEAAEDKDAYLSGISNSYMFLDEIEDGTGVRCFVKGTYNWRSGTYTEATGIIDRCYYGSGRGHDHLNPDGEAPAEPVVAIGQWQDLNCQWDPEVPDLPEDVYLTYKILPDTLSHGILYRYENGAMTKLLDTPVKEAVTIETGYIFCITEDDRLLAVSADGSQVQELYSAQYGQLWDLEIAYVEGSGFEDFYMDGCSVIDGSTVIQVDLKSMQYRQLLTQEYLIDAMIELYRGVQHLYFETRNGLHVQGYLLNLETGELEYETRL